MTPQQVGLQSMKALGSTAVRSVIGCVTHKCWSFKLSSWHSSKFCCVCRGTMSSSEQTGQKTTFFFLYRESTFFYLFISLQNDVPPLACDNLANAFPFPLYFLLQSFLCKVQTEEVGLILVAPLWPHMAWFPAVPLLLSRTPFSEGPPVPGEGGHRSIFSQ